MSGSINYPQASPYLSTINQASSTYGVPANLLYALIGQESSFNPTAQTGNASGIAQFMPGTASEMGVNTSDPTSSINGAAAYLSKLYGQTGSWVGAVTGYGTVPANQSNLVAGQQNVLSVAHALDGTGSISTSASTPSNWIGSLFGGAQDVVLRVGVGLIALIFIAVGLASLALNKSSVDVVKTALKD